jgi:hypothetical protein
VRAIHRCGLCARDGEPQGESDEEEQLHSCGKSVANTVLCQAGTKWVSG